MTALAGCGDKPAGGSPSPSKTPDASPSASTPAEPSAGAPAATGSVYYLNFKPEQDEAWQALAAAYTAETGVPVTVETAAQGGYETTLMAEIT